LLGFVCAPTFIPWDGELCGARPFTCVRPAIPSPTGLGILSLTTSTAASRDFINIHKLASFDFVWIRINPHRQHWRRSPPPRRWSSTPRYACPSSTPRPFPYTHTAQAFICVLQALFDRHADAPRGLSCPCTQVGPPAGTRLSLRCPIRLARVSLLLAPRPLLAASV
jgi:hypothetical protein